ncbi:MAG: hypothetical protein Q9168_002389 [Polycauliona sp. 1 TL-2023]
MSLELANKKCRVEGSAKISARWALAHLADRYEATVAAKRTINLLHGQEERRQNTTRFNNLMKKAHLWYLLVQRYRNIGIPATVPESQTETCLRNQSRWPAFPDVLDLLRPEFCAPRLNFYAQILDHVAHRIVPDEVLMMQMERWTSPAHDSEKDTHSESSVNPLATVARRHQRTAIQDESESDYNQKQLSPSIESSSSETPSVRGVEHQTIDWFPQRVLQQPEPVQTRKVAKAVAKKPFDINDDSNMALSASDDKEREPLERRAADRVKAEMGSDVKDESDTGSEEL